MITYIVRLSVCFTAGRSDVRFIDLLQIQSIKSSKNLKNEQFPQGLTCFYTSVHVDQYAVICTETLQLSQGGLLSQPRCEMTSVTENLIYYNQPERDKDTCNPILIYAPLREDYLFIYAQLHFKQFYNPHSKALIHLEHEHVAHDFFSRCNSGPALSWHK